MIEQRRRWLDQILIVLIALLPGISALSEPPIYAAKKEAVTGDWPPITPEERAMKRVEQGAGHVPMKILGFQIKGITIG